MTVAAWTAAAGFTSGIILNAVNKQRGLLETVPWTDPVVLRMGMLVSWLIVAAVIARVVKQRPGGARTIVWLSLVSFAVLTGSILWGLFGDTRHGVPPVPASPRSEVAA